MNKMPLICVILYYFLILFSFSSCISIAGTNIALSLAILFGIWCYVKIPRENRIDVSLLRVLGIFLAMMFVSGIFGYNPAASAKELWSTFYRMLPLVLIVQFIKDKSQIQTLLVVMGISVLVADGYAIWQGLHGNMRAPAFYSNPMIFAGVLIQMIPLSLIIGLGKSTLATQCRQFFMLVFLMSMIALLFNGTRGAWIAVVIAIMVYGLLSMNKNKKVVVATIIILSLLGAVAMSVPVIKDRVVSIANMNDQSSFERLLLWDSAWQMFTDHKLLGVGPDNFKMLYQNQYISPLAKEPDLGHAHNNFMHILAEMGIAGISAFVLLFGYILVSSYTRYKKNQNNVWMLAVFIVTLSLLIQGLTEYNFDDSAVIRLYWFIMGIALAVERSEGKTQ